MNQARDQFGLSDFDPILNQEPLPLLIGGQAVNLWALAFLPRSPSLAALAPFLSKDCDLYGGTETLIRLAKQSGWQLEFGPKGQASPVVGYLTQAHDQATAGNLTERGLVNLLEETLRIVAGDYAMNVSQAHGVDFQRCFPPNLEHSNMTKVKNFVRHRLKLAWLK